MHPRAMARARRLDNYSGWMDVPQMLKASAGTLLEDFEVFADWTLSGGTGGPPTITDDTTNYRIGSHSLLYAANGATGNVDIYKTVSWALGGCGSYFDIWVRNNDTASNAFTLFLSATWPTKYFSLNLAVYDTSGDWVLLRVKKSAFTAVGSMTWADTITRATFRFNGAAKNINLDGFYHSVEVQPAVVFSFDDCLEKTYFNAPKAFNQHNAVGAIFITGDYIGAGGYFTAAELNEFIPRGWEVGNHSETHPHYNTLTQAEIETELTNCISDLNSAGVTGHVADKYAGTPWNEWDADIDAALTAQGFRIGRTARATSTQMTMELLAYKPFRTHTEGPITLANLKTTIDTIVAGGSLYLMYHHGVEREVLAGSDVTVSMLAQALAWCARYRILVLTYGELYDLLSGPVRVRRPKRAMTAW